MRLFITFLLIAMSVILGFSAGTFGTTLWIYWFGHFLVALYGGQLVTGYFAAFFLTMVGLLLAVIPAILIASNRH